MQSQITKVVGSIMQNQQSQSRSSQPDGRISNASVDADTRRARRLEYFTIGWNALEAVASIVAGAIAGSTALVGFGLDSAIESTSGAAVLWRFRRAGHDEARERVALKLVGASFLVLAAYVAAEAVRSLVLKEAPDASPVGIVIAVLSLIVMPLLARAKRQTAWRLSSRALEADSRQTLICAYLSALLLLGLVLNATLGLWWADPVAALAMTPVIAHEGIEALRGKTCDVYE